MLESRNEFSLPRRDLARQLYSLITQVSLYSWDFYSCICQMPDFGYANYWVSYCTMVDVVVAICISVIVWSKHWQFSQISSGETTFAFKLCPMMFGNFCTLATVCVFHFYTLVISIPVYRPHITLIRQSCLNNRYKCAALSERKTRALPKTNLKKTNRSHSE